MPDHGLRWSDLEVVKNLGEGQAGIVQLCRLRRPYFEYNIGDYLAIKRYKRWILEQPGQLERILRELEYGRRIKHPNLVHSISALMDDEGMPVLIMKYYDGETLEHHLEKLQSAGKYIPYDMAMQIIGELASALYSLHTVGLIHRDIKPGNIILVGNSPILMDLGVVKCSDIPELTSSGDFLGTIRYSAPEYLFGQSETPRMDVYSLGTIAYELFIGKKFLQEESNWARLIVLKSNPGVPVIDYQSLGIRIGINRAEFVRFILENSLSEENNRSLDLSNLDQVIKDRIWAGQFHTAGGKVIHGTGSLKFTPLKNDNTGTVTPEDIAMYIRSKLSNKELRFLKKLLRKYYWVKPDWDVDGTNYLVVKYQEYMDMQGLEEAGIVETEIDVKLQYFRFLDAVRIIFRYGLL